MKSNWKFDNDKFGMDDNIDTAALSSASSTGIRNQSSNNGSHDIVDIEMRSFRHRSSTSDDNTKLLGDSEPHDLSTSFDNEYHSNVTKEFNDDNSTQRTLLKSSCNDNLDGNAEIGVTIKSPTFVLNITSEVALKAHLNQIRNIFSQWSISSRSKRDDLRRCRQDLIDAARIARDLNPSYWSAGTAFCLKDALETADRRLLGRTTMARTDSDIIASDKYNESSQLIEELTKLETTKTEVSFSKCAIITLGWAIVAIVFYIPWLISAWILMEKVNEDQKQEQVCLKLGQLQFLISFSIVLVVNLFFNWLVSAFGAINGGKNFVSRHGNKIVLFVGLAMVGLNLYGLIIVWQPTRNDQTFKPEDCNLFVFVIVIICFFLAFPVIVFAIQYFASRLRFLSFRK